MPSDQITPGERRELKSLIKNQFRVVALELKDRKAKLNDEVDERLRERYRDFDAAKADFTDQAKKIQQKAEAELAELKKTHRINEFDGAWQRSYHDEVTVRPTSYVAEKRSEMATFIRNKIESDVRSFEASAGRREVDLLKQLSLDALESAEARDFAHQIPTIDDILPSSRVLELEAAFEESHP